MRTSHRPWIAGLGVIPLILALTGCFGLPSLPSIGGGGGDDDTVDDGLVEEIVEGSGDGIDFEAGELPPDFPKDDVPLVAGEVQSGMSISDGQAWIVVIAADDEATANTAPDLLEAAGYSNDSVFAWENDDYLIVVVGATEMDDGRWAVQYQVQVKE